MRRLALLSLLATLATPTAAQTPGTTPPPAEPGLVERVTVRLVQLNFLAVDDAGRPVPDLRPEEIELFVNGDKQRISFLQPYYSQTVAPSGGEAEPGSAARDVAQDAAPGSGIGRWWMLVFDHFTTSARTRQKSIEAAREFLSTRLGANDRAALVVFDGGMRFVQGFTTDVDALVAGTDRLVESSKRASEDRGRQMDGLLREFEDCRTRAQGLGGAVEPDKLELCVGSVISAFEESRVRELDAFAGALTWLLYASAAIPEVKAVVLFSEGVSRAPARDAADAADAVLGISSARLLGPRGRDQIEDYFDTIAEAASVSKAAVFTINPGGGMRMTAIGAQRGSPTLNTANALQIDPWRTSEQNAQMGLQEIAWRTGGQATQGADIVKELERIEQLSPALYTVGFYPTFPDDPAARRKVKIRVLRKDVRAEFQRDVPPAPADRTPLGGELLLEPSACDESGRRALVVKIRVDRASLRYTRIRGDMTANYSVLLRVLAEGKAAPAFQDFRTLHVSTPVAAFDAGEAPDPVLEQRLTIPCLPFTVHVTVADAGTGGIREFTGLVGD